MTYREVYAVLFVTAEVVVAWMFLFIIRWGIAGGYPPMVAAHDRFAAGRRAWAVGGLGWCLGWSVMLVGIYVGFVGGEPSLGAGIASAGEVGGFGVGTALMCLERPAILVPEAARGIGRELRDGRVAAFGGWAGFGAALVTVVGLVAAAVHSRDVSLTAVSCSAALFASPALLRTRAGRSTGVVGHGGGDGR